MPFTFSHPAIVLPFNLLKKNWFSLTGLVLGSITPDFEYFIKMEGEREFGHTWTGLFWFNLPLALLLAFVFHNIVKAPLIDHLPRVLKGRFFRYRNFNWNIQFKKRWFIICISILIGSLSHLFLDSFTNVNGYFVERIPFLSESVYLTFAPLYIRVLSVSSIVSYVLSVLGGCVVLYSILQLPVDKHVEANHSFIYYWIVIGQSTLVIVLLRLKQIINFEMKFYWYLYFPIFLIIGISALIISITVTSLIFRFKIKE